jgi:selenoprotein W-related protein
LAAELLDQFEPEIESVTLIPSEEGRYEIEVNGELIYSKLKTNRHAQPGEISNLIRQRLESGQASKV